MVIYQKVRLLRHRQRYSSSHRQACFKNCQSNITCMPTTMPTSRDQGKHFAVVLETSQKESLIRA